MNKRSGIIKDRVISGIVYALLGFFALIVLFPFFFMLLTSVKSYGEYNSVSKWLV